MQGRRKRCTALMICTLTVATLCTSFSVDSFSNPAHAAGQPYSETAWAGVRVASVFRDDSWRTPDGVYAQWNIPCLPTADDGSFNQVDMWIGMESADGAHLIQTGISGWHHRLANGVVINEYWGWAVNTGDPNTPNAEDPYAIRPHRRFNVDNCGPDVSNAIVYASVYRTGRTRIEVTNPTIMPTAPALYELPSDYPMTNPRFADCIIERPFGGAMPNFGTAKFNQCTALLSNGDSGIIGNSDVRYRLYNMFAQPGVPRVMVQTYEPNMYGDFELRRLSGS